MNRYEEALYHSMDAVAQQLTVTGNPRHRAILELYRRAAEIHRELLGRLEPAA